ncbi:uncharacterized protein LY89DRAFT_571748 [Mollisia scopiformis]|uniref:Uncharacterized protein n=1 Tax=Mollisia scopiformis TaxID=149040 RepID=A0A194XXI4_MOLSC|nr:uncharacterized protein LY89DRAFT_571748 [Mollisia scopiformis]KUJ24517.1 hypothetical protein LY89DRAFT_571748 [Mollisia scopiformis]
MDFLDTLTDSNGLPTAVVTMKLDTLTNSFGRPTATVTEFLEVLRDPNGSPTQTLTMQWVILTDSIGRPTATVEQDFNTQPTQVPKGLFAIPVEPANYFIVSFLPVLIAIVISVLIQIINRSLKNMLPFFALSKSRGALARDSLCMAPGGLTGPFHSVRLLFRFGELVSLFCDILVFLAAVLVTISSEAVGVKLEGSCKMNSFSGCSMYFDLFKGPSRAAESLMVAIGVIIACIGVSLYRIRSRVAFSPWSIASTAALLSGETAKLLQPLRQDSKQKIDTAQIVKHLEGRKFALGFYLGDHGGMEYGIIISYQDPLGVARAVGKSAGVAPSKDHAKNSRKEHRRKCFSKQFNFDYGVDTLFLTLLCGLLILVVYYDAVQLNAKTNSFERFIDSQTFGVRSVFSGFGVIISFFWDNMFSRVMKMECYKSLSRFPRRSNTSILASSNITVFLGLWRALWDRNLFAGIVAFTGILSKVTPLLLSNIPFRITQTWETHKVCAWMTVAILAFMIVVLVWCFLEEARWPYMPLDPNTIAGSMYYLCDSPILGDFEGTSRLSQKELKARLKGIGKDYRFGEMVGVSGQSRIGIYRHRATDISRGKPVQRAASVSTAPETQLSAPSRSRTTRTI